MQGAYQAMSNKPWISDRDTCTCLGTSRLVSDDGRDGGKADYNCMRRVRTQRSHRQGRLQSHMRWRPGGVVCYKLGRGRSSARSCVWILVFASLLHHLPLLVRSVLACSEDSCTSYNIYPTIQILKPPHTHIRTRIHCRTNFLSHHHASHKNE